MFWIGLSLAVFDNQVLKKICESLPYFHLINCSFNVDAPASLHVICQDLLVQTPPRALDCSYLSDSNHAKRTAIRLLR